jgi:hypothetical protein
MEVLSAFGMMAVILFVVVIIHGVNELITECIMSKQK